ncbi:MAG: rhomboid family intramembrane serine protease, partial [Myxococcales bacterium]|nr:rhomboid family intramembrane serine protease [Myxococcales bacterium]
QQTIDAVKDRFKEVNLARRWRQIPAGFVTIGLIAISVIVFFVTQQGKDLNMVRYFTYKGFDIVGARHAIPHELFQGHQYWRVLTPIFLHFGFLHILFNMIWLYYLGAQIEGYQGSGLMIAMVLVMGIASNTGQYFVSGPIPLFGGMSGVVYGLFGYVWMRSHFDASSGYFIDKWNTWVMVIWYFVGFTGLLPIANMAHSVGFVIGLIWGYSTSGDLKRRWRQAEWRMKQ